ncbi:hypothetical protein ZHAS_00019486 [Anopheles sinensis]|uniref:Uncharacterized protein n=1 Tax=Anopheles sinensis TaxID=74873 RepID=A0A084WLX7_ANOSI|nr:hypothetical protein ZHAS_00019486 [Anopheles sinensis]
MSSKTFARRYFIALPKVGRLDGMKQLTKLRGGFAKGHPSFPSIDERLSRSNRPRDDPEGPSDAAAIN